MQLTKQEKNRTNGGGKTMIEKTVKRNKENTKDHAPGKENYYALIAVILNPNLSVDEAIRYFHL